MVLNQIAKRRVIAIHPSATVLEACERMAQEKVGAIVVLDEGVLVGIFSERDVLRRVIVKHLDAASTTVADVMTKRVTTVTEQTSSAQAMELMHEGAFRHLPLVDSQGSVIGMLSVRDLLRQRVDELDLKNNDLLNFISADGPGG